MIQVCSYSLQEVVYVIVKTFKNRHKKWRDISRYNRFGRRGSTSM